MHFSYISPLIVQNNIHVIHKPRICKTLWYKAFLFGTGQQDALIGWECLSQRQFKKKHLQFFSNTYSELGSRMVWSVGNAFLKDNEKETSAVFFLIPIRNWAAECFDLFGMPFSKTILKKHLQFFSNTYSEVRNWAAKWFDRLGMPFSKTIKKKQVQFFQRQ